MKIIYLHQYFNTPDMAGGTRSYEMARRLVKMGHTVHLVTSDQRGSAVEGNGWYKTEESGIVVHWLPVPYSNSMSYHQRMRAFFKFAWKSALKASSLKGDVIFASSTPLTIALPAVFASKWNKIPMVFEVRDLWPELPIALGALKSSLSIFAARGLERFAYRNSEYIVALSEGMKDGVLRTNWTNGRVTVIPNSCDLELFDVPEADGQTFRDSHSWLLDRPLVVYTGTLGLIHGVDYLVRLASVVDKIYPEIRFLIVGDGKQRFSLEVLAEKMGVLNRNVFFIGKLPKRKMAPILSAATFAASTVIDLEELWPNSANKFFDALASRTPLIINYQGWQADLLRKNNAGIVVDPNNLETAAGLLIKRVRDENWIKNAKASAHKMASEKFSRDQLAEKLANVLSGVVNGSVK